MISFDQLKFVTRGASVKACPAKGLQVFPFRHPQSNFLSVFGNGQEPTITPKKTKDDKMIMQLTVFKEVHNTWPAKNGKPAGESYDLLCMDISNPPEHRMEEMLYYRTKDDERPKIWGKSVGNTIQVGVSKIRHGDNGGKATLLGSIIAEAKKN